jgi:preprotein translocase subunit YajC
MSNFLELDVILAAAKEGDGGGLFSIGLMVIMFAFMYLFMIRPQKVKEKKLREEVAKLKKGDAVMLESGIYGEIHAVEQESMQVKIADKCIIKVHQRGVRVLNPVATVEPAKVESK